jgi:hypothetical protein
MSSPLERLAGPGQPLAIEPPDVTEFESLKRSGLTRLRDAENPANSLDGRFDLGDVVALVDGRPTIVAKVAAADAAVRDYIAAEIRALLDNPDFIEALPGFLLPDAGSQAQRSILEARLRAPCG